MVEVTTELGSGILNYYNSIMSILPSWGKDFLSLFLLVILVLIYSIFIWKFYRFIATKNIIKLNLNRYNKSESPFMSKFVAGLFYFIEYIVILPFLIFFWVAVFAIFLIFLTNGIPVSTIVIISATIIAVIRMTSYYSEDLSRDIAKMLPFVLLSVAFLEPGFFDVTRVLSQFGEFSVLMSSIFHYLLFIILLEIVLRFFTFLFALLGISDEKDLKN